MILELVIPFPHRLRGVVLSDPNGVLAPLQPPQPSHQPEPSRNAEAVLAAVVVAPPPAPPVELPASPPVPPAELESLDGIRAGLEQLGNDLRCQQRQRLKEMQAVAVELALAVATHLIHKQISKNDFPIEQLVKRVAERLEPQQAATVYLNSADLNLLNTRGGDFGFDFLSDNPGIRLASDDRLPRGDCRAETGDLSVASCLEEQLAEIRAGLLESLPELETERRKARPTAIRRFPERRHTA